MKTSALHSHFAPQHAAGISAAAKPLAQESGQGGAGDFNGILKMALGGSQAPAAGVNKSLGKGGWDVMQALMAKTGDSATKNDPAAQSFKLMHANAGIGAAGAAGAAAPQAASGANSAALSAQAMMLRLQEV